MELQENLNEHLKQSHKACLKLHDQICKLNSLKASIKTKKIEAIVRLENYVTDLSKCLQKFRAEMLLQLDICQENKLQLIEETKDGYESEIVALDELSEKAEKYVHFFRRYYTETDKQNARRLIDAFKLMLSDDIDDKETDDILHLEFKPALSVACLGPLYFGCVESTLQKAKDDRGISVPDGKQTAGPSCTGIQQGLNYRTTDAEQHHQAGLGSSVLTKHPLTSGTSMSTQQQVVTGTSTVSQQQFTPGTFTVSQQQFTPGTSTVSQQQFTPGTSTVPQQQFTTGTSTVPQQQFTTGTSTVPQQQFTTGTSTVSQQQFTPGTFTVSQQQFTPGTSTVSQQQFTPGTSTVSQQQFTPGTFTVSQQQFTPGTSTVSQQQFTPGTSTVSKQQFTPGTSTVSKQQFTSGTSTVSQQHFTTGTSTVPQQHFTPWTSTMSQQQFTPETSSVSQQQLTPGTSSVSQQQLTHGTSIHSITRTCIPWQGTEQVQKRVVNKPKKTLDELYDLVLETGDIDMQTRANKTKETSTDPWVSEAKYASPHNINKEKDGSVWRANSTIDNKKFDLFVKENDSEDIKDDIISEHLQKLPLEQTSTCRDEAVDLSMREEYNTQYTNAAQEFNDTLPENCISVTEESQKIEKCKKATEDQLKDIIDKVKRAKTLKPLRKPLRLPKVMNSSHSVFKPCTEIGVDRDESVDVSVNRTVKHELLEETGDSTDSSVPDPLIDAKHGEGDAVLNADDRINFPYDTAVVKIDQDNQTHDENSNSQPIPEYPAKATIKHDISCRGDTEHWVEPKSSTQNTIAYGMQDEQTLQSVKIKSETNELEPINPAAHEEQTAERDLNDVFVKSKENTETKTSNSEERNKTSDSIIRDRIESQTKQLKKRVQHFLGGEKPERSVNYSRLGALQGHWLQNPGMDLPGKLLYSFSEGLKFPIGVTTDTEGRIIVTDTGNDLIKIYSDEGKLIKTFGDDILMKPSLRRPSAVVVNEDNEIFVKDDFCIYKFSGEGEFIMHIGKNRLGRPYGLDFTPWKYLITLDTHPSQPALKHFSQDGTESTSYVYAPLLKVPPGSKCRFMVVSDNYVIVSDLGLSQIYVTNMQGEFILVFGHHGIGPLHFNEPSGLSVDLYGNVVIGDSKNNRIKIYRPDGSYTGLIQLDPAVIRPSDLHFTKDNKLIVVNFLHHRISVYQL